jgi:hypothetical protein
MFKLCLTEGGVKVAGGVFGGSTLTFRASAPHFWSSVKTHEIIVHDWRTFVRDMRPGLLVRFEMPFVGKRNGVGFEGGITGKVAMIAGG